MQVNRYIALPKDRLLLQRLFVGLRLVLYFLIIVYLYRGFIANQQVIWDYNIFSYFNSTGVYWGILLALLLFPANWLLEAVKWQVIAKKASLSLFAALRGVVLGLTLDNILPLGIGAVSGRIVTIKSGFRTKLIPGILAGQLIQSMITFLFGLIGFAMVWDLAPKQFNWQSSYTVILVGIFTLISVSLVFWRSQITSFLKPLLEYELNDWIRICGLSVLRYIIFLSQLYLLAKFIDPQLSSRIIIGCGTWVFAARTFMPKVSNLERLGIRALAVLFFAKVFSIPATALLLAVTLLWLINLALPSLIGLFLLRGVDRDLLIKR